MKNTNIKIVYAMWKNLANSKLKQLKKCVSNLKVKLGF